MLENGTEIVTKCRGAEVFNRCVTDGLEFTGRFELEEFIYADYIFLDHIEIYQRFKAKHILEMRENQQLSTHSPNLHNGFTYCSKI